MRKIATFALCAAALASVVFLSSCRKDEAPKVGGPELEEVGAIAIPEGVIAFAGVKSLTDITTAATDIGSAFNKGLGPLVGGQISALVQGRLIGTRNLTWMDPTAPMRVVALDPARFPAPFVFIGAVAFEDGLKAALDEPADGPEGNATAYKGKNGRTMYLNRIGKYAVFTMEPGAWVAVRDFLKKDLLRHPFTRLVDAQATAAGFKSVVKPLVDARLAVANTQAPTAMDLIASELAELLDFIEQTSAIRVTLGFSEGVLAVEGSALPVDGTTVAKFAAGSAGRKLSLFRQFPVEGWVEFASNVDPELFAGVSARSMESVSQFLPFSPEEKKEFEALVADNIATQSGEMAIQVGYEKKFPFRVAEIVALRDGALARQTIFKTYGMMFTKFGTLVNTAMPKAKADGSAIAPIDFADVDTAIASSRELLGSQGVVVEHRKVNADGVEMSSIDFTVDATMFPADDPNLVKFRDVLGERLSGGIGFDDSNMYLTVGLNAIDDISRIRSSSGKGATKLARVVEGAGYDVSIAARLSLVDAGLIASHVARGVLTRFPSLAVVTERPDLAMTIGSRSGRVVLGTIAIPVSGIAGIMQPPPREPAPAADDAAAAR